MKKNVFLLFLITSFLIGCTTEVDVHESARKDTTPPGAITNLSVKSDNKSITLSWNNPTDEDFSGTSITFTPKVNSITQPVIVEGIPSKTSTKTFSGLRNNVEYTFTLVALDKNENGSEPASIKATPADTTPPAEVRNLTATVNENSIKLEWLNPSDEDFYGVEISLTPETVNFSQPIFMKGNPSEKKELTVKNLETEEDYTFTVQSIDIYNNKSSGIQRKATTKPSSLTLDVILPNDGDNIIFTNDEAPIKVTVTSSNEITKAVWKKGIEGISVEPNLLLNDSDATSFSITTKTPEVILHVTENGIYDIAAQNEKGIIDYKQVEIKTIDKNPLPAVTNLSVNYEHEIEYKKYGRIRYIEWINPVPENTYDAPIKNIIISCIYNDNETDTDNTTITINDTSTQNYSFELSENKTLNDYVHFNIKIIDTAGNESEITCSAKTDCGPVFVTDIENVPSIIENARSIETKIITIGDFADSSNEGALEKIAEKLKKDSKRIYLDLSETKNLETLTSFSKLSGLRGIIIPEGITEIENGAFEGCSFLSNVVIPESVTKIGYNAFKGCRHYLTSIIIPEGVTEIENGAFEGCESLSSITIPKSMTTISSKAFNEENNSIKEIYYTGTLEEWCSKEWSPGSITRENSSYDLYINNKKIEKINIQKGITRICDFAFADCKSLSSVVIPEGVTEIGTFAFARCPNLTNIIIPNTVTKIGDYTFENCTNLSVINIPEGVTEIGAVAFSHCTNLSSIVIPESVSKIGVRAFEGCSSLTNIVIPKNVTKIDNETFAGCRSITNIVIPESVTEIGRYAFSGCGFSKIEIRNDIKISESAFPDKLSSITFLKTGSTSIDEAYLKDKSNRYLLNLTTISIPNNITYIDPDCFKNRKIKEIYYQGTLEDWCAKEFYPDKISTSYELYLNNEKLENANIKDGTPSISNYTFYGCSSLSSIVIPESVTEIGNSAFENCTRLSNINIPEGVTKIGQQAFKNCSNLTNVIIPKTVTEIESSAFENCTGLSNIDIPEGVTIIGQQAFKNCSNLTEVIIPKTVTEIGSSAFENCTSLSAVDISEGVTVIGGRAFRNCSSLTEIIIPKTVTEIGSYAFENCTSLSTVDISEGVTEIRGGAFSNCSSLTEIIIPKTVTVIGEEAFSDCTNLTSVILPSDITELERKLFYNCNKLETITIPSTVMLIYSTTFEKCDKLSFIRFIDTETRWYKYTAKENEINKVFKDIYCTNWNWTWGPSSDSIGKMSTYKDKSFFTNNNNYAIFYNRNFYDPKSN